MTADRNPRDVEKVDVELESTRARSAIGPGQVYSLVGYYALLLVIAAALLIYLVLHDDKVQPPLLRLVMYISAGAIVGSVLYQIRMLYRFYIKEGKFDPKWMGKYLSAPWEAVALSVVVLSILQGGGAVLGGEKFDMAKGNSFAAFGFGALVGFGIREVVGWMGNLAKTMFPTDTK